MTAAPLRLGTRRSALALAQSHMIGDALEAALGRTVEYVEITTEGDVSSAANAPLSGTGVFVNALRDALVADRIDVAVHSFKDLPTAPCQGIVLAAVPVREDPRDVLVCPSGKTLGELPAGSTIGTGSPRRMAQLRALGLGLEVVPVRGNVDTRIAKAVSGEVDAVVLARAGLARLGRLDEITETLDPLTLLPAPAQGALAIECRQGDPLADAVASALDHRPSRVTATAERALLAALEAGCTAPVGALADLADDDELYLRGVVASIDGSDLQRLSAYGPAHDPEALGRRLADDLLADGAGDLMGHE